MQIENVSPAGCTAGMLAVVPGGNQHCQPSSRAWHGPPKAMDCEWPVPPVPLSSSAWLCRSREGKAEGRKGSPRSGLYLGKVGELPDREVGNEGHTEDFKLRQEGEGRKGRCPEDLERNWMSQSGDGQQVGRAEGGAVGGRFSGVARFWVGDEGTAALASRDAPRGGEAPGQLGQAGHQRERRHHREHGG